MFQPKLHKLEDSPHTAKFYNVFRNSSNEVQEWLSKYSELHNYSSRLESIILNLENTITRLTHENEFMVRMLKENNNND